MPVFTLIMWSDNNVHMIKMDKKVGNIYKLSAGELKKKSFFEIGCYYQTTAGFELTMWIPKVLTFL